MRGWSGAALMLALAAAWAQPARNDWYRHSLINMHCDNHSLLLGKDVPREELLAALRELPVTMIQVSAQSNGYATYPTRVGLNNPEAQGYDTLDVFKAVTQRLDKKLCIYMSVDRRPLQIKEHPGWAMRTATGEIAVNYEPCVCMRPNRAKKGYLYEQFLPQIREIIARYDPDGFWFDGDYVLTRPCWCERCLEEWKAETGHDAPRDEKSPLWDSWLAWHYRRFQEYRRIVAETIHQASRKALYTSNWSWAWNPEPLPEWADTLSGDGSLTQFLPVVMRWGAQDRVPWDLMSHAAPYRAWTRQYSPQRIFQEGALAMAYGGNWFAWTVGSQLTPAALEMTRRMAAFVRARTPALGPSRSLSQIAVLDSETTWAAQGRPRETVAVTHTARCLQEARYFTDIVNEQTLRQGRTPYYVVVLPTGNHLAQETLRWLEGFVQRGGTLLVCDDGLPTDELLGVKRLRREASKPAALLVGEQRCWTLGRWEIETTTAETRLRFADGKPALTLQKRGAGRIAYLAISQIVYPEDEALLAALRALGLGPSYGAVAADGEAPLLCNLRAKDASKQIVLHIVDLSSRINGRPADINTRDFVDENSELRNVRVALPMRGRVRLLGAYPPLTGASITQENGWLRVRLAYLKDHAALVFGYDTPPTFTLGSDVVPETKGDFHPVDPQTAGFFEDFELGAVGSKPAAPWQAETRDRTAIAISEEQPASGRRCLKLIDAPGCSFWPYLHRSVPPFRRGRAELSFDLRIAGAECLLEIRYEGKGAGPFARFTRDGELITTRGKAISFPLGQWLHVQCAFVLGGERPGYTLTITIPSQAPHVLADLPYATDWFFLCDSIYFVGSGDTEGSFSLDNIRFERQPL